MANEEERFKVLGRRDAPAAPEIRKRRRWPFWLAVAVITWLASESVYDHLRQARLAKEDSVEGRAFRAEQEIAAAAKEQAAASRYNAEKARAAFRALPEKDRVTQAAMDEAFRNPGRKPRLADGYFITIGDHGIGTSGWNGNIWVARDETTKLSTWCEWAESWFSWVWRCTSVRICRDFWRGFRSGLLFIVFDRKQAPIRACRDPITGLWSNYKF